MKITFTGTFDIEDMQLISDFLEQQQTTDRETESVTIEHDSCILIKVTTDKLGQIEKINFKKINK